MASNLILQEIHAWRWCRLQLMQGWLTPWTPSSPLRVFPHATAHRFISVPTGRQLLRAGFGFTIISVALAATSVLLMASDVQGWLSLLACSAGAAAFAGVLALGLGVLRDVLIPTVANVLLAVRTCTSPLFPQTETHTVLQSQQAAERVLASACLAMEVCHACSDRAGPRFKSHLSLEALAPLGLPPSSRHSPGSSALLPSTMTTHILLTLDRRGGDGMKHLPGKLHIVTSAFPTL